MREYRVFVPDEVIAAIAHIESPKIYDQVSNMIMNLGFFPEIWAHVDKSEYGNAYNPLELRDAVAGPFQFLYSFDGDEVVLHAVLMAHQDRTAAIEDLFPEPPEILWSYEVERAIYATLKLPTIEEFEEWKRSHPPYEFDSSKRPAHESIHYAFVGL